MRGLLGLLVITCVTALPDECSWGESYWCSSLKVAKSCGAVTHCIGTVWSHNTNYKNDNTDICQYCENFIGDVRKFVEDKSTQVQNFLDATCNLIPVQQLADQSAIQAQLDAACGIIPITSVAEECKDYVDNYLPEIFQMIEAQLDPKAVCATLGLCSGFQDRVNHAKIAQDLHHVQLKQDLTKVVPIVINDYRVSGDICTDCKTLISDVAKLITDKTTESQVEQLLKDNVCSQLGGLQDECNTMVDTYIPELMELLSSQVDPELVCGVLGFCQNGDRSLLAKMKLRKTALYKAAVSKVQNGEFCTICEMVITELQNLDRDAKVQSQIESFLKDNLCSKLGSLQQECSDVVTEYGAILFELLSQELDPTTDCQALGLCAASASNDAKFQLAEKIRLSMLPMKDFGQLPAGMVEKPKKVSNIKQSVECVLCEFVMTQLDQMLGTNKSEEAIRKALDQVCDIMPDTIKLQCKDFVDTYAAAVIELLLQELSPDMVCTSLGLCSGKAPLHRPIKALGGGEMCGVCETIVQYVESLLQDNATRQQIEATLEKVCNFLPTEIQAECNDFIKQYAPLLIDLLEKELTPTEVCTELGLCSQVNMVPMMKIVPAKVHLLGENECTYGPSYWCVSKDNAKKCGAEEHCNRHGWLDGSQ